jgi:sorting nexin-4
MNTDEFTDEPINDNGSLEQSNAKSNVTEENVLVEDQDLQNEPTPQQQQQDPEDKKNKVDVDSFYTTSVVKQPQKESDGQNAYISYLIETEVSIHFFLRRYDQGVIVVYETNIALPSQTILYSRTISS